MFFQSAHPLDVEQSPLSSHPGRRAGFSGSAGERFDFRLKKTIYPDMLIYGMCIQLYAARLTMVDLISLDV